MKQAIARCVHSTHDERLRECESLLQDVFGRMLDVQRGGNSC
jgi:hypothetical protein